MAYMHVKGSTQGSFLEDGSRAGKGGTLCLAVRFRGDVPHDVRRGKHAVTQHEPVSIVHEWSPATVHFVVALWSNEVLDEVIIDFVRHDHGGEEEVYATLTMKKATVAYVELRSGRTESGKAAVEEEWHALDDVGLHAEKIEFKLKNGTGHVTANYDRAQS